MQLTTKHLAEIRRRNEAGENDSMIADALGLRGDTVSKHRRQMGLPQNKVKKPYNWKERVIYTIWDAETDELLACGTSEECVTLMGYAGVDGFRSMVSRALHGKQKKYHVEKVREAQC